MRITRYYRLLEDELKEETISIDSIKIKLRRLFRKWSSMRRITSMEMMRRWSMLWSELRMVSRRFVGEGRR